MLLTHFILNYYCKNKRNTLEVAALQINDLGTPRICTLLSFFLLYINDIATCKKEYQERRLFAGDTNVFVTGSNSHKDFKSLQNNLNKRPGYP